MKIKNKITLVTVLTLTLTHPLFAQTGYIAPSGGGGADAGKIIKANIAKAEQNLAKCRGHLKEIEQINKNSQQILDNFDKVKYNARLENIRNDIVKFELELKNEKNPAKQSELNEIIKTIKKVDAQLRRRGV